MSNLTAVGVVLLTLFAGGFLITWIANTINMRFDMIVTGVLDGTPISLQHRRMMLHNMYYQYLGSAIGVSILGGLGMLRMANYASTLDIRNLAYLAATLAFFPAAMSLIVGTTSCLYCARVLREADSNRV